jgi:uncharacterized protein (TIGR02246 family)
MPQFIIPPLGTTELSGKMRPGNTENCREFELQEELMSFDLNATRRHAMSAGAAAALALAIGPTLARAQDATPEAAGHPEEEAVGEVLMQMATGFAMRDADIAAAVYTEDAEWINAFGDWVVGRENIHAKLSDLFSTEEFDAGQPVGEPTGSVRVFSDDAAVGWTYQEIEGQQVAETGEVIPLRKNHSLAVFSKTEAGWLITAHMFMDENITE